ncbi:UDP-glucose 4-epimerase [Catalinimonas alkaloidigena]|uniref:NAD-dependent epimerase/dehydratase family protein n=1 Tax=Catalinimonas alkaloidigena TaxID=1075417 RepID=UPI0024074CFB|nr:SDR family oxidoreductase [Catalinimonas alkaloidigena]MDF9795754.1 UDP-glucose 4-epimerase [Catalinimonas alkaloidigena]
MSKNLLITGGLGNLGSWLTDYFCRYTDMNVFVLASRKRPIFQDLNFTFITCDISDAKSCQQQLSPYTFDHVVHTASVNDYFKDNFAKDALLVNALGTRNLLDYFKDKALKNFIYFSTFQVYGQRSGLITEETPTEPKNDYGSTHLFAEYYVKQFFSTHHIPYTIFRLTNSYGCPKDHDSSKWYLVLNDLSRMAATEGQIVLKSNGQATRDFIWMGDVCKIVQEALERPAPNDYFNIAGEETYTMLYVAEQVREAYQEMYGKVLPIKINREDQTVYPDDLKVSAQKLQSCYEYEVQLRFKEEAKNIFKMLNSNS